jgi:Ca2+-binding EF-hand superfamily protein
MLAAALTSIVLLGLSATEDPPKSKKRQSVEEVFKRLDKNSDGKVTLEEFKAHPGLKNKEAAAKAFKAADANADDKLSLAEFRDWAEKMAERSKRDG